MNNRPRSVVETEDRIVAYATLSDGHQLAPRQFVSQLDLALQLGDEPLAQVVELVS